MSENRSVVEPKQFLEHTESEIFPFQVSGHDLMLRTNDGNVSIFLFSHFFFFRKKTDIFFLFLFCFSIQIVKVASEREVRFYERVSDHSPELLEFIPVVTLIILFFLFENFIFIFKFMIFAKNLVSWYSGIAQHR